MQAGTGSGEEAISEPEAETTRVKLDIEPFAVVHDEPFLSIVYSDGEFKGEIVNATLERVSRALEVAEQYNLIIDGVDYTDCSLVQIHLTEKGGQCP